MRQLVELPAAERLARMSAKRWIGYSRARQALAQLEVMLEREPGRVRPRCMLIVGQTNGTAARLGVRVQEGTFRLVDR
jgi:hypothetical protein